MKEEGISVEKTKSMMIATLQYVAAKEPLLTAIDCKIGDGDHGFGIKRGFSFSWKDIEQKDFVSVNILFKTIGLDLLQSMGGASGILFATLFTGGLESLPTTTSLSTEFFADMIAGSFLSMKKRGRSSEGHKTLLDTIGPVSRSLLESERQKLSFQESSSLASIAAYTGCLNTMNMIAGFGRARKLGASTLGIPDPGAVSAYYIFASIDEFLNHTEIKEIDFHT
jgi:dihydroxyacetone kinase-like protein